MRELGRGKRGSRVGSARSSATGADGTIAGTATVRVTVPSMPAVIWSQKQGDCEWDAGMECMCPAPPAIIAWSWRQRIAPTSGRPSGPAASHTTAASVHEVQGIQSERRMRES